MQQLLFLGLGLWVLSRMGKKPAAPGLPTPQAGRPDLTPQGARVVTTNAVLQGKLPCIDPDGPNRVAEVKQLEAQLRVIQEEMNAESQRSQPDEDFLARLSKDADRIAQEMTDKANVHAAKCKKYFEDYARRTATPATGLPITTLAPNKISQ